MVEIGPEDMWTDFYEKINNMLIEEKRLRHLNEHNQLATVCCDIVSPFLSIQLNLVKLRAAFEQKEYGRLREWLLMLCKRRGQAKKSTTDMIDICMNTFMDQLPTREEKFNFL